MKSSVPQFFATPALFRRWLKQHHRGETELWVGFYKKGTGKPSITWPESVDEALCFGWIDGIRKSLGDESYVIRFTPRRVGSIWSDVNTRRAGELIKEKRMRAAGLEAFKARVPARSGIYAFEQRESPKLDAAAERTFRAKRDAWAFFQSQPPGYRRIALWWVVSAKREATRARRLATLMEDSAARRRIGLLQPTKR
jgi:uncharacterized protein YdeI (YjbR/CyaY-like superfamily)